MIVSECLACCCTYQQVLCVHVKYIPVSLVSLLGEKIVSFERKFMALYPLCYENLVAKFEYSFIVVSTSPPASHIVRLKVDRFELDKKTSPTFLRTDNVITFRSNNTN